MPTHSPATPDVEEFGGTPEDGVCRTRYERMSTDRESYIQRGSDAAKLTLPYIMTPPGHSSSNTLPTPFQSVGARGANNLASKLLLALFPPNAPFFKYLVDPYVLSEVSDVEGVQDEVEANLLKAEEAVQGELETRAFRVRAYEALRHLLVAGNALVHDPHDSRQARVFSLKEYVVERDPEGHVLEIITRETLTRGMLPSDVREKIESGIPIAGVAEDVGTVSRENRPYELFTRCQYSGERDKWRVYQECANMVVEGTAAFYEPDDFPYIPLRGNAVSGENYGRGYVEEYIGDLITLDGLTQAIVEGAAAMARILFFVNPAGTTDAKRCNSAPNGAFVAGNAADIQPLQVNKFADFTVAANTANAAEKRLEFAFLLNTAIQRNAERVTAEEVRFMAQELEQMLGGLYSLLSQEFQLPIVKLTSARMARENRLPKMPDKVIRPSIVTGIEALGRGNDLTRLNAAMATIKAALGDSALELLNRRNIMTRAFTASGVRTEGVMLTEDEVAQAAQQRQLMELASRAAPSAVTQVGAGIRERVQAGEQQAAPQQQ